MNPNLRENIEFLLSTSSLPGFITPRYDGLSILNASVSLCKAVGVDLKTGVPELKYLTDVDEDYDYVVTFLVDALGFLDFIKRVPKALLKRLKRYFDIYPITTVAPSTTTTVLASFYTGRYPQQHGLIGYRIYFREYGLIVKIIEYSPIVGGYRDSLGEEGIDPREILPYSSIFEVLREKGVKSYMALNKGNINSMFTKLLVGEAEFIPYLELEDMLLNILEKIRRSRSRVFIHAYWGRLDSIGHEYGPDSRAYIEHMRRFLTYFLNFARKSSRLKKKGLIALLSDHGQVQVDPEKPLKVTRDSELLKTLLVPPYGDSRFVYFKIKDENLFLEKVEKFLPTSFKIYESEYLLEKSVFGIGKADENFIERIGDYVAIPRDNSYLLYSFAGESGEKKMRGRHGSLTEREMIVPFLISKFS